MKKLFLALGLLLSTGLANVNAAECTASMVNRNGREIEDFTEYDRDPQRACYMALNECQRELRERWFEDRNRGARCIVERRDRDDWCDRNWWDEDCRDRPGRGRALCEYNLVSRIGGGVVRVYRGVGRTLRQACAQANRRCEANDSGLLLTCVRGRAWWSTPEELLNTEPEANMSTEGNAQ